MKLVWSPDTASKAYVETIKSGRGLTKSSSVAEMLSAMAGGWNAKLIVEAWYNGGEIATSVGLAVSATHSGGRHVCIVPDKRTSLTYINSMQNLDVQIPEIIIGEVEDVIGQLNGIDFLVVDSRRKDFLKVLRLAKLSHLGAVLVLKNACNKGNDVSRFRWSEVVGKSRRVVRSVILPVGNGLEIAYVGSIWGGNRNNNNAEGSRKITSRRWIRRFDLQSGEEHVFRG
ncbi:hypothetical protein LIER_23845 [Lithospermum erythrorhizon]|uniref:Uncharacterized protein n=1 Tax=Lithospermum erythrorhizon TaxID=34254 RepID=A0AAV3R0B2_LITER